MNPNRLINAIVQLDAKVVQQVEVAEASFLLSLEAPQIARGIAPGQFVQIRCTKRDSPACMRFKEGVGGQFLYDPLLPRPFSVYRVREKQVLDILYEVVGRGTQRMAETKEGDRLNIFGPLGNTFSYQDKRGISFLVGGGVGLAPFYDLAEVLIDPKRGGQRKEDVIVLLGARSQKKIFCEEDFRKLGVRFEIATEDGSYGFKGLVTELLEKHLHDTHPSTSSGSVHRPIRLYACGPKAMLRAIAGISEKFKLPCEVSIDAHMPCGYGICFGCAVKTRVQGIGCRVQKNKKTDLNPIPYPVSPITYKLACTDGPIFKVEDLVWDP